MLVSRPREGQVPRLFAIGGMGSTDVARVVVMHSVHHNSEERGHEERRTE
jgi:hypothetical protein